GAVAGSPYHVILGSLSDTADGVISLGNQEDKIKSAAILIPDLEITKTASVSTISAPGTITYTIDVINTGTDPLAGSGIVLSDPFASGLTLIGDSDNDGDTTSSTLDVGETWTFTATHSVSQAEINAGGTLTNT